MRLLFLTIFWMLALSTKVVGQFNEIIRSGRPGQAIGAFTVGQHVLQIQSGVDYFKSIDSDGDKKREEYLNNTVLRYGLSETFEVSAVAEYKTEAVLQNDTKISYQGLSALDVGMRVHIFTGKGFVPNVGFQTRLRLPFLTGHYQIKDIAPLFVLATSQQLFKKFTLITNWGNKLGVFVETFGSVQQGVFISNFDTGLAWLINNDLQFDVYGGYGINQGVRDYFVSTGISWRMKTKARDN